MAPSLSRRLGWERRAGRRIAMTDTALVLAVTAGVGVAHRLMLGDLTVIGARPLPDLAMIALVAAVWLLVLAAAHSRDAAILCRGAAEYTRVVKATIVAFVALAIPCLMLDWDALRFQLLVAMPIGLLVLLLGRRRWRRWLVMRRRSGEWASRAVVVGSRDEVTYVLDRMHRSRDADHHVVCVSLSDGDERPMWQGDRQIPVLGSMDGIAETAQLIGADSVIIASDSGADSAHLARMSQQLEGTCAELVLFSRLMDIAGPRISFKPVDGMPLISLRIPTFEGPAHAMKRALDIVVASCALVAVAIISVPIAIAIRLESRGPILFRQERVGRDGETFEILKFRTMRADAEQQLAALQSRNEGAGPLFKITDDPRVTRVGRLLRRTSLDELPQFWNVLRGEMSVVGPRPPLASEVTTYDGMVARRMYLKPGLTGLWQISGRSNLSWEDSVRLDLRYIENWSVMDDLIIMWRTARVLVRPDGAY